MHILCRRFFNSYLIPPLLPLLLPPLVTCVIMQRCGAGLHTASASFSNPRTDSQCCVRWDNNTMHSIVTVFALRV